LSDRLDTRKFMNCRISACAALAPFIASNARRFSAGCVRYFCKHSALASAMLGSMSTTIQWGLIEFIARSENLCPVGAT